MPRPRRACCTESIEEVYVRLYKTPIVSIERRIAGLPLELSPYLSG